MKLVYSAISYGIEKELSVKVNNEDTRTISLNLDLVSVLLTINKYFPIWLMLYIFSRLLIVTRNAHSLRKNQKSSWVQVSVYKLLGD